MKLIFHFITSFFKINKIKINKNSLITKKKTLFNYFNRISILLIFPHLEIGSIILQLMNPPFHTID